jgi:uncharacterized damage-inducible protein DinB
MSDQILRELVYGRGAHVDPLACVEDISSELAMRRVENYPHCIWQLVLHINYWMDYDFRTIAGEAPRYPERAIESWPATPNAANDEQWKSTTARFGQLLARLKGFAESDSAELERMMIKAGPGNSRRECSVHTTLWEIAAHNSYHVGQIAMLRRQAGAWPPERGGDTW